MCELWCGMDLWDLLTEMTYITPNPLPAFIICHCRSRVLRGRPPGDRLKLVAYSSDQVLMAGPFISSPIYWPRSDGVPPLLRPPGPQLLQEGLYDSWTGPREAHPHIPGEARIPL